MQTKINALSIMLVISSISLLLMVDMVIKPNNMAWAFSFTSYSASEAITCQVYNEDRSQFALFYITGGNLIGEIATVNETGFITHTLTTGIIQSASALSSADNCASWLGSVVYVAARPTNQNSIISGISATSGTVLYQTQLTGTDVGCIATNVLVYNGAVVTIGTPSGTNDCQVNGVNTDNNVYYSFEPDLSSSVDTSTGLDKDIAGCEELYLTYLGVTANCEGVTSRLLYNNDGVWTSIATDTTDYGDCVTSTTAIYCTSVGASEIREITASTNDLWLSLASASTLVRDSSTGNIYVSDGTTTLRQYDSNANLEASYITPFAPNLKSFETTQNIITFRANGDAYIMLLNPDGTIGGGGGQTPEQEFCSMPENANLLQCRLAEESGALVGTSDLLNVTGTNISCMVGIIACTQDEDGNFTPDNPDIKTNGVGYLLTAIALGVFVGIIWVASRGDLLNIPTFIWFIGTLAIVGATTIMDWIDPTFLVITVIAIIAMAVAKAKGVFGERSQLFAGE